MEQTEKTEIIEQSEVSLQEKLTAVEAELAASKAQVSANEEAVLAVVNQKKELVNPDLLPLMPESLTASQQLDWLTQAGKVQQTLVKDKTETKPITIGQPTPVTIHPTKEAEKELSAVNKIKLGLGI